MTVYPEPNSSQVAVIPPGSGQTCWLGTIGHVTALRWSFTYPGGPDKMSCVLEAPAALRSRALDVGATVRVFRGGHKIWEGILDEPAPSPAGWQISAVGVANLAADYLATWSSWPSGQPDEIVNNAISRGLPWVNPGVGQPSGIWLGQQQDSASRSVKDVLDLSCSRGGLAWYVNCQPGGTYGNDLRIEPLPSLAAPSRLLVCTSPVPRTVAGDIKAIYIRYQTSADNVDGSASAAYAVTSVTNTGHGGSEQYLDLSNAGVMSAGAAQAVGSQILKVYQRSSFAGPFDIAPGYLLTLGGVPVDPGMEQAGFVARLVMTDYPHGAEISPVTPICFIAGVYEWDDHKRTGTVTPYQTVSGSLSSLLSATSQNMTPVTVA